ncbi:hypothetical protein TELCIR_16381 [Teladorsagia circumcincta]|uniref:Protein kinase domain-containing protein n=1 Tax=Teladorsagia circumcincta TaxID=45464 RepID=A0A2G9TVV5_TELCI|nr:hypothetical protein TELCIR_16381 [Teladorsagia circumcincta]
MVHSITRTYVGTTVYMAPERLRGGVYRIESDIWSFGLSLWELAVGHYPLQTPKDALLTTSFNSVSDCQPHAENVTGHPQTLCVLINGWEELVERDRAEDTNGMDQAMMEEG